MGQDFFIWNCGLCQVMHQEVSIEFQNCLLPIKNLVSSASVATFDTIPQCQKVSGSLQVAPLYQLADVVKVSASCTGLASFTEKWAWIFCDEDGGGVSCIRKKYFFFTGMIQYLISLGKQMSVLISVTFPGIFTCLFGVDG